MTIPEPLLEVLRRYYQGLSIGNADLMAGAMTDDVVHYFPTHDPIRGAAAVAAHWVEVHTRTDATWTLDHGVGADAEAVVEWTMKFRHPRENALARVRGVEWYVFRDGRISEIRPYYHPGQLVTELRSFPYAKRGYPT